MNNELFMNYSLFLTIQCISQKELFINYSLFLTIFQWISQLRL